MLGFAAFDRLRKCIKTRYVLEGARNVDCNF
jgi:hypothetical protein